MVGVDRQVREQTVVGLEAEHVDGVTTFVEEAFVVLLDQLNRVLEEGLWVKCICVEVQRQDALVKAHIQPEGRILVEDDLEEADENLRLALVVYKRAVSFVVSHHHACESLLHIFLG